MDLSVIVVSFNTRDFTLACLNSVYAQTEDLTYEVIVIDNGSSDGSGDAIKDSFPQVTLLQASENLGFAAANNQASRSANGEYLLLLNPDTIVLENAIERLVSFARANQAHKIYGGRTIFLDGSLNVGSCWAKPTLWSLFCYASGLTSIFRNNRFFDPEAIGGWQRDSVAEVGIVSGCFLLIERKLWEALAGFDEMFFMYGEDADLCLRAYSEGASPVIYPGATIIHIGGASEKVRAEKMIRLFTAKKKLIDRYFSRAPARAGLFLLWLSVLLRAQLFAALAVVSEKRFSRSCEAWQKVWRERRRWLNNDTVKGGA